MSKVQNEVENDPEKLWKADESRWERWTEEGGLTKPEDHPPNNNQRTPHYYSFISHFKIQTVIAIILLGIVFASSQISHPYVNSGKTWVQSQLSHSFNFVAIANWYEKSFEGSPSFIPNFGNKSELALAEHDNIVAPIKNGVMLRTFAELLNGVEIVAEYEANVVATEQGRVIHVREQQDSVIIQHSNNRMSIYTRLGEVNVKVSDWVEAGDEIGKLAPVEGEDYSVLFFSIKQNNQYIDPLDVISID